MEENKKYTSIINAGKDLFYKHGFKRITVGEVCRKAGVSKMTFYKFFTDKTDLAKKIFNAMVEDGEGQFRKIMSDDSPSEEKIRKLIMMKFDGTTDISQEFLQDFYTGSGELKEYVEERTRKAWDLLIDDFKNAQKAGYFRQDFKPELMIKIQGKLAELLDDSSVTSMYGSRQELIMEFAKFMFYGVAPHN